MQVHRVTPGRRVPARFAGAVLARDLTVSGERWSKGRRLTAADLTALAAADPDEPVSVLVPEPGELHEDDAAIRLATAVAGPGLTISAPAQSRVDLHAEADGVLNVRVADLERLNRIDPLEVFTAFDGQVVAQGDLVASVKIAPHLVDAATVDAGARLAGFGSHPLVWVAPFLRRRVGVIVKESVRGIARERFEASVHAKIEGLGSEIVGIEYVEDDADVVEAAMAALRPSTRSGRPHPDRGRRQHGPARRLFRGDRSARRPRRPARRPGPPGLDALARPDRQHGDPGPADLWRLLEGDRGRPAPAAPPVGRGSHGADGRKARPWRHPDPQPAFPVPGLRARARRSGRVAGSDSVARSAPGYGASVPA